MTLGKYAKLRICKTHGYVFIKVGRKWVRYHRWLISEKLGRPLRSDEVVHHINGVKTDNRLSNLEVLTQTQHKSLHSRNRTWNDETKSKMSLSAKLVAARPGESEARSIRAKYLHSIGVLRKDRRTPKERYCKRCGAVFVPFRYENGTISGSKFCDCCRAVHSGGYYKHVEKVQGANDATDCT